MKLGIGQIENRIYFLSISHRIVIRALLSNVNVIAHLIEAVGGRPSTSGAQYHTNALETRGKSMFCVKVSSEA